TEEDLDLITALANFAAVAIERAQLTERVEEERKIRSRMERYHSPAVVDEIVRGSIAADEEQIRIAEVSILFADISGFTTVTEKRVDYTVLGSAVNIASRLESGVAKPGQTVISQNTLNRTIGSFQTEPLGEVALKGLQQTMPVYAVIGAHMGATSPGMSSTQHAALR